MLLASRPAVLSGSTAVASGPYPLTTPQQRQCRGPSTRAVKVDAGLDLGRRHAGPKTLDQLRHCGIVDQDWSTTRGEEPDVAQQHRSALLHTSYVQPFVT